jgi:hypothetical protein
METEPRRGSESRIAELSGDSGWHGIVKVRRAKRGETAQEAKANLRFIEEPDCYSDLSSRTSLDSAKARLTGGPDRCGMTML